MGGSVETTKEVKVTRALVEEHGLTEEYARIVKILGREPNYTELGIFSAMWSEHCSYKSSKIHLKKLPSSAPHVIQGPGENAGVVEIGDGLAVAFKMESHNHPSFIEPYQGAATGVGGILRDIFTMGARPIASLNSLRFGPFDHPKTRYLLERVVEGIADYGNCIGVPTVGGETYFHPCYSGNNLVNVFTLGVVKVDGIFRGRARGAGNPVIYVGSKTGRDGIHGATMASEEFGESSEQKRPNVQVGDPFTEKLLLEACLELVGAGLVVGMQDMGAAGLTSSSFEMASRGGVGMEMDLSLVPRREEGMTPYELMLSESQERMLIVAEKGKEEEVLSIFRKWDLDAIVIGRVTEDGTMRISDGCRIVAEMPVKPLVEDAPVYDRASERPEWQNGLQKLDLKEIPVPEDLGEVLLQLLSSPDLCGKGWIYHQYDHMVRTNTLVPPGSDAAVIRIKGTNKAVAITVDGSGRYCYLDPLVGGMIAVTEAARNLVCSGAKPLALTDCLNFGNPEKPEIMWQFQQVIEGMSRACGKLGIPVVSGNVSFYNETQGEAVHPTPTVGMVGLLEDASKGVTHWFKEEGDLVALLGETKEELGGSHYLSHIHGMESGALPLMDLDREKALQKCCVEAAEEGIIRSAHDPSEGGLAVALAECCISGGRPLGAQITLSGGMRVDALLFGESQSRIVVSLRDEGREALERLAEKHRVPVEVIGQVSGERLIIRGDGGDALIDLDIHEMKNAWSNALEGHLARMTGQTEGDDQ